MAIKNKCELLFLMLGISSIISHSDATTHAFISTRSGSLRYCLSHEGMVDLSNTAIQGNDRQYRRRLVSFSSNSIISTTSIVPSSLLMSLKPAALPLMDSGKALAQAGEFIIEWTNQLNNYGGALSAVGAQLRNAGDNIAQAAASCRFKTGMELVSNELREAATQLAEGRMKMKQAVTEMNMENNTKIAARLGM
jgi:hypothetical protein